MCFLSTYEGGKCYGGDLRLELKAGDYERYFRVRLTTESSCAHGTIERKPRCSTT